MSQVLLLRHAQSLWNAEGRWQGWADVDLSPKGITEATNAIEPLVRVGAVDRLRCITRVVASDLRRAQHTGELLAEGLGVSIVHEEPGLRERSVGDWTGLLTEELEALFPGQLAAFQKAIRDGKLDVSPPGGESVGEIRARVFPALQRVFDTANGEPTLAVTHGGIIRTVISTLGMSIPPVKNLHGVWLSRDENGMLQNKGLFRPLETPPDLPITSPLDQIF